MNLHLLFLHWEWSNNFLKPESSSQAFYTSSILQVRSSINNKSVGGWKNYKTLIQPARDYLIEKEDQIPEYFKNQIDLFN